MAKIWSKTRAIEDLVNIKDNAIKEIPNDQKAATVALNSIKELNSICGINKSDGDAKSDKVVIKDDI